MSDVIETIKKEIQEKEQEIQRLQEAKRILEGKLPSEIVMEKYKVGGREYHKPRRRIKFSKWSEVEVRQVINLYNTLNLNYGKKLTRIANIMKMPRKRIANKVYNLKMAGLLKGKVSEKPPTNNWTNWTEEREKTVIELTNKGYKPKTISRMIGIDIKAISNKLWELRKTGHLPPLYRKSKEGEKKGTKIMDIFK